MLAERAFRTGDGRLKQIRRLGVCAMRSDEPPDAIGLVISSPGEPASPPGAPSPYSYGGLDNQFSSEWCKAHDAALAAGLDGREALEAAHRAVGA
jgi:hypothetical protein